MKRHNVKISFFQTVNESVDFLDLADETVRRWNRRSKLQILRNAYLKAIRDNIKRPDSGGRIN